jgi:hypothetical protein
MSTAESTRDQTAHQGERDRQADDLVERTKCDPGAPLEEESLFLLLELKTTDAASFARIWARLKCETKCGMSLLRTKLDGLDKATREFRRATRRQKENAAGEHLPEGAKLDDFHAFLPSYKFYWKPGRSLWPAASVDAVFDPIQTRNDELVEATKWLAQNRPLHEMTWSPGAADIICDHLVREGGFIDHPGARVANTYLPPTIDLGDPALAGPWLDHVRELYPDDAEHLFDWLAFKVQNPGLKVNHAVLLGGATGIGKDTILDPVRYSVGDWNFADIRPTVLRGRFNGFAKSVILRINEVHDLDSDTDAYAFYELTKHIIAAPPEVILVDEKNLPAHHAPNVTGVILTSNHKTVGLYLPPDDRRHYVAWSDQPGENEPGALPASYFEQLYSWLDNGGRTHVAAWLKARDLSRFNPKAAPPRTDAFREIVNAQRAPEETELADVLEKMAEEERNHGKDKGLIVFTLAELRGKARDLSFHDLVAWLEDRKYRRILPMHLERLGYRRVTNPDAADGRWRTSVGKQIFYGLKRLPRSMLVQLVKERIACTGWV